MSYNVKSISVFEKQAKKLNKKYPSLKSELTSLIEILKETPDHGTPIGKDCYKIRLSIASKRKGKSGGARIITHILISENTVYLLSIYDKSEKDNLTDNELKELISYISD
jgi:mRNA-degrading endonuclease RelE of RelBE toxin-antitoxin system